MKEHFLEQLAIEKPYTVGNVNSVLSLLSGTLKPREMMAKSKEMKAKVGQKRLLYCVIDANPDGTPRKEKFEKVWEDELDDFHIKMTGYSFLGMEGVVPKFGSKNIK